MALPTILLREFQTATISDWIPGKLAQTYKQLESLTFGILSRNATEWNVHFHLEDDVCEGKALRLLWDNGAYFDNDCLKGGKLHLYAHFVRKDVRILASQTRTSSTAPSSRITTNVSSRRVTQSSPMTTLGEVDLPLSPRQYPPVHPRSIISIPQKRKRANVHDLSDSDSEGSGETQFILSASDRGRDSDEDEEEEDDYTAVPQPGSNVTQKQPQSNGKAMQHAVDFSTAITTNAPCGKYGHKKDWELLADEHKHRLAHARLIKGTHGCPSPSPCTRCEQRGLVCRTYHLGLKTTRECGECLAAANICDMNVSGQSSTQNGRASELPLNLPLQNSDGSKKFFDYCPVITCTRRTEPFTHKPNFLRHVRSAHPEYDETRLNMRERVSIPSQRALNAPTPQATVHQRSSKGAGTFVCPIQDCQSPSAGGFSRGDNFRRHVRLTHPESIHAQILEAVLQKNRITLPPPPSNDEYSTDFNAAVSNNASSGAFGHRPIAQWAKANPGVKVRIAHAKLINSKYGVIAPESCDNCRRRGTACMVYHPGLKNVGRALGTYCGECRDRSVKCGMTPDMFNKILRPADDDATDGSYEKGDEQADENALEDGEVGTHIAGDTEDNFDEPRRISISSEQDNEAQSNDEPVMKQEEKDEAGTVHLGDYVEGGDDVIYGEDFQSPHETLLHPEGYPENDMGHGVISRMESIEHTVPPDNEFSHYSKYVDQAIDGADNSALFEV